MTVEPDLLVEAETLESRHGSTRNGIATEECQREGY